VFLAVFLLGDGTRRSDPISSFTAQRHSMEARRVLTRLLIGGREQPLDINMGVEPEGKQQ
jgi:hypothetical protein